MLIPGNLKFCKKISCFVRSYFLLKCGTYLHLFTQTHIYVYFCNINLLLQTLNELNFVLVLKWLLLVGNRFRTSVSLFVLDRLYFSFRLNIVQDLLPCIIQLEPTAKLSSNLKLFFLVTVIMLHAWTTLGAWKQICCLTYICMIMSIRCMTKFVAKLWYSILIHLCLLICAWWLMLSKPVWEG